MASGVDESPIPREALTPVKNILIAIVAAVIAAVVYHLVTKGGKEAAAFNGVLKQYGIVDYARTDAAVDGNLPWSGGAITISPDKLPPRTGKIMVVRPPYTRGRMYFGEGGKTNEEENARIDPLWFDLDPSIRAMTPEEVGTLILAEWGRTRTGAYVLTGPAGTGTPPPVPGVRPDTTTLGAKAVYLKIYDMRSKVLVGCWLLEGQPPPDSIELSAVDKIPGPPLAAFLKAMPAK